MTPAIVGLIYFMTLSFAAAAADDWQSLASHACVVTVGAIIALAWLF